MDDQYENEFKNLVKFADILLELDNKKFKTFKNDRKLEPLTQKNIPSIPKFYENLNIFITGGSGFMGKALIEKLLRSCSGLNKIYLLLRAKKGRNEQTRLEELFNNRIFDRLKQENPNALSKVCVICGNCETPNFGLSNENLNFLKENIDIVYHVAASVRFDDSLRKAVLMNVRSTRDVALLTKQMKNLKVLIHVSTSYCNIDKPVIDEIVYPCQADWRKIIQMVETLDEYTIRLLEPKILNKFPNTYTFTKSLAENIIDDECKSIPTVIFRPSIVVSSIDEPVPGWTDNLNGPAGIFAGTALGLLHNLCCDEDVIADYVPVDKAINSMIISSWYQAHSSKENHINSVVINACTSNKLTVSYGTVLKILIRLCRLFPLQKIIWYPFLFFTRSKFLFNISFILFHLLPGIILERVIRLMGEKFSLMNTYRKAYVANNALLYFMTNQWIFKNGNFLSLNDVMLKSDNLTFDVDFLKLHKVEKLKNSMVGFKRYLLKEDGDFEITLPKSRANLRRFYIAHCVVIFVFCLMAFLLILIIPTITSKTIVTNYLSF